MPERPLNRICYVEDDEDIQRIVRMSLERVWMMPVLDGPALFRQMKLRPETSSIPVVFITARASQPDLDELKLLGAAATISKPFSPRDLPEQLRAIWAKLP
jgi:CheY-like chemotaxis protein